jgi:tetratricopeptide (TPR) repeat protein
MRTTIMALVAIFYVTGGSARADPPSLPDGGKPPENVSAALARGDNAEALRLADDALTRSPSDPWLHYARGSALVELGRLEDGFTALRKAEQLFPGAHEKSLAIYRRAITLDLALRCADARREFAAYEAVIRDTEPLSVKLATRLTEACVNERPTR